MDRLGIIFGDRVNKQDFWWIREEGWNTKGSRAAPEVLSWATGWFGICLVKCRRGWGNTFEEKIKSCFKNAKFPKIKNLILEMIYMWASGRDIKLDIWITSPGFWWEVMPELSVESQKQGLVFNIMKVGKSSERLDSRWEKSSCLSLVHIWGLHGGEEDGSTKETEKCR